MLRKCLTAGGVTVVALALGVGLAWGLETEAARAAPGVIYVAPGGDCGGATPCYGSVQAAVDAATGGDEIWVAMGTYTGDAGAAAVVSVGESVTIRGGYTTTGWTHDPVSHPTTLDGEDTRQVVYVAGDISPTLEGLRVVNGRDSIQGGGIGIFVGGGQATISNCLVCSNTAPLYGGGISVVASDGTLLVNNEICNNAVTTGPGGGWGGGIYVLGSGGVSLVGNEVYSNVAAWGGGIILHSSHDAVVTGNQVYDSTATECGGGIYLHGSRNTLMSNDVVVENSAGYAAGIGFSEDTSAHLLHTTVARNDGRGIELHGNVAGHPQVWLTNTILVSHTVGVLVDAGGAVTLSHTLWGAGAWANGLDTMGSGIFTGTFNWWEDPDFVAPDTFDYHIGPGSGAIDRGVCTGVTTDVDGESRVGSPDLGADELATALRVTPGTSGVLTYTDTHEVITTVQNPAGVVTETTVLVYTPLLAPTNPISPGLASANHAFTLEAYRGGAPLPGFVFETPVSVTVHYTDGDVAGVEPEDSLALYTWNGAAWEDAACGSYTRNTTENWLAAPICHLSEFAGMGEKKWYYAYLPLAIRNYPPVIQEAPDACPGHLVQIGVPYREDFDAGNDNDYWSFLATAGTTYTIETFGLEPRADTQLTLFDPSCQVSLAYSDDVYWPDDVSSRIVWVAPFDGVYHAQVRSYDWRVYGADTGYSFRVSVGGLGVAEVIPAGAEAKPPPPPTPTPANLGKKGLRCPALQKPPPPPTPAGGGQVDPTPTPRPSGGGEDGSPPAEPAPTPTVILLPETGEGQDPPALPGFSLAALGTGILAALWVRAARRGTVE